MGPSPTHASSVPLVLRPSSGAITPQFHVVFDDWFATIATSQEDVPDFGSETWARLFGDSLSRYDNDDVDNTDHAMNQPMPSTREQQVSDSFEQHHPPQPLSVVPPAPPTAGVLSPATQMSPTRETPASSVREPPNILNEGAPCSRTGPCDP